MLWIASAEILSYIVFPTVQQAHWVICDGQTGCSEMGVSDEIIF